MNVIEWAVGQIRLKFRAFEFFQKFGIHITPNHFYSPIPDTRILRARKDLWEEEMELVGVDLRIEEQLNLLENVFVKFREECDFPLNETSSQHEYYIKNNSFGLMPAIVLHCMIRHFTPKTIIEVGSGNSTFVSARASLMNQSQGSSTRVIAIEPYPNQVLQEGFPGLSELIPQKVEEVDIESFSQLEEGDILSIDSTHVVRMGGDVNFLYLKILPRLNNGVVVHIHDIFFPKNYPEFLILGHQVFFTEQYLLQAFLTYNNRFEVLWCGSYMYLKYKEKLQTTFPLREGLGFPQNYFSSSFWMRKIG